MSPKRIAAVELRICVPLAVQSSIFVERHFYAIEVIVSTRALPDRLPINNRAISLNGISLWVI